MMINPNEGAQRLAGGEACLCTFLSPPQPKIELPTPAIGLGLSRKPSSWAREKHGMYTDGTGMGSKDAA